MRIRTGHKPEDWTENVPADPGYRVIRGSFVVGGPIGSPAKFGGKTVAKVSETPDNGGASQPQSEVSTVSLQP